MLNLVKQPKGTNICVHCCLATIANVPLERIYGIYGHYGPTSDIDIFIGLRALRIDYKPYRKWNAAHPPKFALVLCSAGNRSRHMVIFKDGEWYDPAPGKCGRPLEYIEIVTPNG